MRNMLLAVILLTSCDTSTAGLLRGPDSGVGAEPPGVAQDARSVEVATTAYLDATGAPEAQPAAPDAVSVDALGTSDAMADATPDATVPVDTRPPIPDVDPAWGRACQNGGGFPGNSCRAVAPDCINPLSPAGVTGFCSHAGCAHTPTIVVCPFGWKCGHAAEASDYCIPESLPGNWR